MGKFKVGDVVKRAGGYNKHQRMRITKVVHDDDYSVEWLNGLEGSIDHWRAYELELANDSPIRTVTRREIVPGKYGVIRIDQGVRGPVLDLWKANPDAEELRAAARIFNEIADVLDEEKEAA